jgi:hypothetical protein
MVAATQVRRCPIVTLGAKCVDRAEYDAHGAGELLLDRVPHLSDFAWAYRRRQLSRRYRDFRTLLIQVKRLALDVCGELQAVSVIGHLWRVRTRGCATGNGGTRVGAFAAFTSPAA